MISVPIPDKTSAIRYQDINIYGESVGDVAQSLTRGRVKPHFGAHLDPDLVAGTYPRHRDWRPLFGQAGSSQTVLSRQGVGVGDLFLFFGWFRQTEQGDAGLTYVPGSPDLHVIWGWLQVGDVIDVATAEVAEWMRYHPHLSAGAHRTNNTLYVAADRLSIDGSPIDLPGAGVLPKFHDGLRLTKPGGGRSRWLLPGWFNPVPPRPPLGYHDAEWRWTPLGDHVELQSVARGQEFVLNVESYPEATDWVSALLAGS